MKQGNDTLLSLPESDTTSDMCFDLFGFVGHSIKLLAGTLNFRKRSDGI